VTLPTPPLLLVTDRSQARLPLAQVVRAALAAGCRWVSLREKDLPASEQAALAETLKPLAGHFGARLMLHGDAEFARACGIDGVHLPAGADPAQARALLGPGALIGVSIHAAGDAAVLDPTLVDYAIAGPAFETASKPGYGPALGPGGLEALVRGACVPILAIGGIEPANVARVLAAGVSGVAVMGAVMRASNPGETTKELVSAMPGAL
jgi:thiamine-phosphate pyrophosphorylase